MAYLPISAFQRPTSYVEIERACTHEVTRPKLTSVAKWSVFNALVKAKAAFGLNERDLGLLQGLLTFHPQDTLEDGANLIIFPSNRKICERLHGMADSTMRRHLRNLIASGLLLRRDSNNGKRFAIRHAEELAAFGFDLSPLLYHAPAIFAAAEAAIATEQSIKKQKLEITLMRRDLFALFTTLEPHKAEEAKSYWENVGKILRRKLTLEELEELNADHVQLLNTLKASLLNSSDSQNEQHIHNADINYYESEPTIEIKSETQEAQNLPLPLVLKACPTLGQFSNGPITHWAHLHEAAHRFHQALGITTQCYNEAIHYLGLSNASIAIAAILERFDKIRSPGAYLRSLLKKASVGAFDIRPMVMALLSSKSAT